MASVPADLQDRRVEITGPTDRKMVINALNSGASMYMADFEDSNTPNWDNQVTGQINMRDAVAKDISFVAPSGKIYELAEVVRDLNKGDDLMIDQSYSERQLFEKAYERLLSEFNIVLGTPIEETQKKLDKALKRNLEAQKAKIEKKSDPQSAEMEPEDIEDNTLDNENI